VTVDSAPQRRILLELLRTALTAVDGRRCVAATLRGRQSTRRPVWAAAVGKAASSMALGAADALGPALERLLLVTKDGYVDDEVRRLPGAETLQSSHPIPDERSLTAGARLLEFVDEMPREARPLLLVSGGASSLVEVLTPGATLEDLRRLNAEGLASGVAIDTLNARRRGLSLVKGGALSSRLAGRGATALFISDVPGDDPAVIGSGLLGPAPGRSDDVERIVIASIDDARRAVRGAARGLRTSIPSARFDGDAERLAAVLVSELEAGEAALHIWGGESVIRLPERPGRGGRNQHFALAAARRIAGRDDLFVLAVGTDGTDGPTADAGALVDGGTCGRIAAAGLDVVAALRQADSGAALAAAGDLVHTGPTGTNVSDLILGLRLGEAEARTWLLNRPPIG
jgi:glycerate 2-kinase